MGCVPLEEGVPGKSFMDHKQGPEAHVFTPIKVAPGFYGPSWESHGVKPRRRSERA